MLRGRACEYDNSDHPVAWSSARVWRHWRLAPSGLELRVRRLKWIQEMVKHPRRHAHTVNSIFGSPRFEISRESEFDELAGKLPDYANPWARLFYADICCVAEDPEGETFSELWAGSLPRLFGNDEVREVFLEFDPDILRRRCLHKMWRHPAGAISNYLPKMFLLKVC